MACRHSYPRLGGVDTLSVPWLANLPVFGNALFVQPWSSILPWDACQRLAWLYLASNVGLTLQAADDKPAALDTAGVSVQGTRTLAPLTTGSLAGLCGAYMAQIGAGIFLPVMTQGNGFIAIVLAMLARGVSTRGPVTARQHRRLSGAVNGEASPARPPAQRNGRGAVP